MSATENMQQPQQGKDGDTTITDPRPKSAMRNKIIAGAMALTAASSLIGAAIERAIDAPAVSASAPAPEAGKLVTLYPDGQGDGNLSNDVSAAIKATGEASSSYGDAKASLADINTIDNPTLKSQALTAHDLIFARHAANREYYGTGGIEASEDLAVIKDQGIHDQAQQAMADSDAAISFRAAHSQDPDYLPDGPEQRLAKAENDLLAARAEAAADGIYRQDPSNIN